MKISTRNLVIMAFLIAISVVLIYLIHFPIFPAAPFLEYDPADVPILIGTFAFGPLAGFIITVAAAGIQALTVSAQSGVYGFIMHVLGTSAAVVTAGLIYKKKHTRGGAAIALLCGTLAHSLVMVVANHFVTPHFMGVPTSVVDGMLLPVILPFNLIKAGANAVITFLVYKTVSRYIIHGEKLFHSKQTDSAAKE
jgi:riboflavin transporter FmnP